MGKLIPDISGIPEPDYRQRVLDYYATLPKIRPDKRDKLLIMTVTEVVGLLTEVTPTKESRDD